MTTFTLFAMQNESVMHEISITCASARDLCLCTNKTYPTAFKWDWEVAVRCCGLNIGTFDQVAIQEAF